MATYRGSQWRRNTNWKKIIFFNSVLLTDNRALKTKLCNAMMCNVMLGCQTSNDDIIIFVFHKQTVQQQRSSYFLASTKWCCGSCGILMLSVCIWHNRKEISICDNLKSSVWNAQKVAFLFTEWLIKYSGLWGPSRGIVECYLNGPGHLR